MWHSRVWWFLFATLIFILAFGVWFFLPRWQLVSRTEQALSSLAMQQKSPGLWRWTNTQLPLPRLFELSRQDEITSHYQAALLELGYATQSSDRSGLRTYFQEAALEDAKLAAMSVSAQASWDHQMKLRFYAPDGATVAFTDSAWLGFIIGDAFEIRYQVLDVVMRLSDGNWRIIHWRIIQRSKPKIQADSRLTAVNIDQLRGVNYVGRSHPFADFWDNWNSAEVQADFRLAKALQLPVIRFFIPFPTSEAVYQNLPIMLELAKTTGVQLLPTLLDSYTQYRLEDIPAIHASITRLLPFLKHTSVLAIDIKNEAERDVKTASWRNIRGVLGFLAVWLRKNTSKPITAGLSQPDSILAQSLDFVTVHHYGSLVQLDQHLVAAKTTNKPVLLEEFGFHTQTNALPDPHTEAEQSQYFAAVLALCARLKVGFLVWNLHDFTAGNMPAGREVERHLGLIRTDGSLKPVTAVLRGEKIENTPWWDRFLKVKALFSVWWLGLIFFCIWWFRRGFSTRKNNNTY